MDVVGGRDVVGDRRSTGEEGPGKWVDKDRRTRQSESSPSGVLLVQV